MSDTYTVERQADVAASPQHVFEHVADLHRWVDWSPWEGMDPDLRRTYSGNDSGAGARYAWSGNRKAGQGTMEILEATPPSSSSDDGAGRVRIDVAFERPFRSRSESAFAIVPTPTGSRVTWTMTGPKTLMTRVMGIFTSMDKLLGPDFEKGLAQLRTVSEKG